jgi:hypothetical protein
MDSDGLIAHLQSYEPIYLVSDGGAADNKGSYGAVLANDDITYVTVSGWTEGVLLGSFRAESYGCLAILRFLYHFTGYHHIDPIACLNQFFGDKKGLLARLEHAAGPLHPFPRHFLLADIDVEMQILDTIRLLGTTLSYNHVKGHQDDVTNDEATPLSREALLNVECDHLATAFLKTAVTSATVIYLPASQVHVTVEGTTITRKLPRMIRDIVGRQSQLASFQRRYGWTHTQFDAIDWPKFRSSSAQFSLPKRLFIIKWLNDILPFQARTMNQYGQSSLAGCPDSCGCDSENHAHLLHCSHPSRLALFTSLEEDLETVCSTHKLDPNLRRLLLFKSNLKFSEHDCTGTTLIAFAKK